MDAAKDFKSNMIHLEVSSPADADAANKTFNPILASLTWELLWLTLPILYFIPAWVECTTLETAIKSHLLLSLKEVSVI